MIIAGEAAGGREVLNLLAEGSAADLVLTDLQMPGMDGIELTGQLNLLYPSLKVLILTMHTRQGFAQSARDAGAKGYILKEAELEELLVSIRLVAAGGEYFPNS